MKDDEKQPNTQVDADEGNAPDGRGPRPTDPNELAKWVVDQTTDEPRPKTLDRQSE